MILKDLKISAGVGLGVSALAAVVVTATPFQGALAQGKQSIEARRAVYAPWSPDQMKERRKKLGLIGPGASKPFPAPSFPSYLRKPKSIEEIMPNARAAVRQTAGRVPLGLAKRGEVVLIVVGEVRGAKVEPMVQEAIARALKERGVEGRILHIADLVDGITREDIAAARKARRVYTFRDGQQELEYFFRTTGQIPNRRKAKDWVKQQDADLYKATWPKKKYPNKKIEELDRNFDDIVQKSLVKYLDDHPEVDRVFWRLGGRTNTRKRLQHHSKKFTGNYTYIDFFDIMSRVPTYPSDVWRLAESKTIESLAFADRVEVTDPEGTAFGYDLTPEMAKQWSKGVYQQGHLFMFPAQATGRYPYSVVEYPAFKPEYLPPIQPEVSGIIASTNSHSASHPRIEIHVNKGRITKVLGGGLYGEGFRLFLHYPGTQDLTWPHMQKPGYWWLYEAGTGTNPKYFKHPTEIQRGINLSERNASGVIHWAFGVEAQHGPEKVGKMSPKTQAFAKKYNLPRGHSMHNHNLMPTYQVRIRDLDQWVTLIEHGRMTALDDLYVRALASRYGSPDEILRQDYVSAIPGITIPGKYDDYAKDPGSYWISWAKNVSDGTYKYMKP